MAKTSRRQRTSIGRVMHEYAHSELKRGPQGKGGKVKSRKQAIAIALHEAGASKYESPRKNKENLRETKRKEAKGITGQQRAEGKSHVGASGRRKRSTSPSAKASRSGGSRRKKN